MKRWIIMALVVVLALSIMAVPAFAAGNRPNFADTDNDGVCDNYVENGCGMQPGCGMARGSYFVDADNDGVCDNMGNARGRRGCCRMAG